MEFDSVGYPIGAESLFLILDGSGSRMGICLLKSLSKQEVARSQESAFALALGPFLFLPPEAANVHWRTNSVGDILLLCPTRDLGKVA